MLKRRTAAGIAVLAASAGMTLGALAAVPAHAADPYPPRTNDTTTTTDPGATTTTIGAEVLGETATNSSGLPVTGGDILGLVAIGGAAALGGTALVRFSRKGHEA